MKLLLHTRNGATTKNTFMKMCVRAKEKKITTKDIFGAQFEKIGFVHTLTSIDLKLTSKFSKHPTIYLYAENDDYYNIYVRNGCSAYTTYSLKMEKKNK